MGATQFEFRFRLAINAAIVALGFWSPWIAAFNLGKRTTLMEWLALETSRTGLATFTAATAAWIVFATLLAAFGAALRVWGTAYLGPGVVTSAAMKAGAVVADGPYRHVRNPLYVGIWLVVAAMSFTMPATGALFTLVLLALMLLRLIFGEEKFLAAQLGETYLAYQKAVPRLLFQARTTLMSSGQKPRWGRAALAELNPIGVSLIVGIMLSMYESRLMIRAFLVCFGLSLVVRALMPEVKLTEQ